MSVLQRIREILGAIRSAKFPPPPKRRYDLLGEAVPRHFGEEIGRGPVRGGAVTDDDRSKRD
jgi:hypothetical protein